MKEAKRVKKQRMERLYIFPSILPKVVEKGVEVFQKKIVQGEFHNNWKYLVMSAPFDRVPNGLFIQNIWLYNISPHLLYSQKKRINRIIRKKENSNDE